MECAEMPVKIDATATGSHARWRTADVLRSRVRTAPAYLLRWFHRSTLRLVVLEIRSFPLRIPAALKTHWLRFGCSLYDPVRGSMGSFEEENRYSRACSSHLRELRRDHPWVTPLDEELASRSHQAGAIWAIRNFGKEMKDTEHAQS